jgi:hypothetical protein
VTIELDDATVDRFRHDGSVVLRGAVEPQPLADEVDDALAHGLLPGAALNGGSAGIRFQGVIMMCERTPVSLRLVDELGAVATRLLGRPALPGRAKATRYTGASGWHVDSDVAIASLGCVAYLEPLTATTGALRVRPGSHRGAPHDEVAIETRPGDVIVFDEHLAHGSVGGALRRQWRADFVADPRDDVEAELVCGEFARILDPSWDLGDDVDAYPSYGAYWQSRDRWWHARLRELGVYDLAARYTAAIAAQRATAV